MAYVSFSSILTAILGLTAAATAVAVTDFDWETITPSRKLEYHPCYDKLQCARLVVPLDWTDESNPHTVSLAITKVPAKVPEDDPSFAGTIFTNPGGPGGSGVGFILSSGAKHQDYVDSDDRHYEILSWDPRGVGFTMPSADCYGDAMARDIAVLQKSTIGGLDSRVDVLRRQHAMYSAWGTQCAERAGNGSILPYMTTASVARDMIEILDKIHELRDEKTATMSPDIEADGSPKQKTMGTKNGANQNDVPRIMYWGFSYGTVLGNTFASMFPGRVGRLIIDGLCNADDYYAGGWLANLQDTEKVIEFFYKGCFDAGPSCDLYRPSDTKWQDMKARVDDLVARTEASPITIFHDKKTTVLSGYEILRAFTRPIYSPQSQFPGLARTLDGALQGNFTLLIQLLDGSLPRLDDACPSRNSSVPTTLYQDVTAAILCSDGEAKDRPVSEFADYIDTLKEQSPTLGAYWAHIVANCIGWTITPKWRFAGPFTTPPHDPAPTEGRPAAPLLFLSTRLDPVTPVGNAFAMSARHPGSSVAVVEGAGHCSISVPSDCMRKIVQEYFASGVVPEKGTSCKADCDPWHTCGHEGWALTIFSHERLGRETPFYGPI